MVHVSPWILNSHRNMASCTLCHSGCVCWIRSQPSYFSTPCLTNPGEPCGLRSHDGILSIGTMVRLPSSQPIKTIATTLHPPELWEMKRIGRENGSPASLSLKGKRYGSPASLCEQLEPQMRREYHERASNHDSKQISYLRSNTNRLTAN